MAWTPPAGTSRWGTHIVFLSLTLLTEVKLDFTRQTTSETSTPGQDGETEYTAQLICSGTKGTSSVCNIELHQCSATAYTTNYGI